MLTEAGCRAEGNKVEEKNWTTNCSSIINKIHFKKEKEKEIHSY